MKIKIRQATVRFIGWYVRWSVRLPWPPKSVGAITYAVHKMINVLRMSQRMRQSSRQAKLARKITPSVTSYF